MASTLWNRIFDTEAYMDSWKEEKERYENDPCHWRTLNEIADMMNKKDDKNARRKS